MTSIDQVIAAVENQEFSVPVRDCRYQRDENNCSNGTEVICS
jgi:hypothetical protein